MAIYHLSAKPITRSAGRSAVAAAAYRSASELVDERTGLRHDYTRKRGVEPSIIVLPARAAERLADRAVLWNEAEKAEKRKDACTAREIEVALPAELSPAERRDLALRMAREMAEAEGCAVDVSIHAPQGDERNHHAHLQRTTRRAGPDGLGEKLDSEKAGRNRKADLEALRERWEVLTNEALEAAGRAERIDHRSHADRGIEADPMIHYGPAVERLEQSGRRTDRGDVCSDIARKNDARAQPAPAPRVADRPREWQAPERRRPEPHQEARQRPQEWRRPEPAVTHPRDWKAPQRASSGFQEAKKTRPPVERREWRSREGWTWTELQDIQRGRQRSADWLQWAGVTKEAVAHDHPARANSRLADLVRSETDRRRAEAQQDRGVPKTPASVGRAEQARPDPRKGHPDRAGPRPDLGRGEGTTASPAAPAAGGWLKDLAARQAAEKAVAPQTPPAPSWISKITGAVAGTVAGIRERRAAADAARLAAEEARYRERYEVEMMPDYPGAMNGEPPKTSYLTDVRTTPEGRRVSLLPHRPMIRDTQAEGPGWCSAAVFEQLTQVPVIRRMIDAAKAVYEQRVQVSLIEHDAAAPERAREAQAKAERDRETAAAIKRRTVITIGGDGEHEH